MFLFISKDKTIHEVQQSFSSKYPFLKLEFYKRDTTDPAINIKKYLPHSITLEAAGLKENGLIDIRSDLTVADLEKIFLTKFGLNVQVSRKSGILWLQTTTTEKWKLKQQNDHGKQLSEPLQKNNVIDEDMAFRILSGLIPGVHSNCFLNCFLIGR